MRRFAWHTVFLSFYSVLFLFAENVRFVETASLWEPLGLVLGISGLIFGLNALIFRSWIKAGLLTSLFLMLFFSYGHYVSAFYGQKWLFTSIRLDHNFYKWSSLLLSLVLIWRLYRSKKDLSKINGLLNLIALVLLVMPLFKIFEFHSAKGRITAAFSQQEIHADQIAVKPSVYYLIMDAYGRNDVLEELYNHDNSDFTDYLKGKGFYIADKSFANYNKTLQSIPSALNLNYMDSLVSQLGAKSKNQDPLIEMFNHNETLRNFKALGYTSMAFDAPILDYLFVDSADLFYETPGAFVNLFANELANHSMIRAFNHKEKISHVDEFAHHRKKLLNGFDKIIAASKRPEPFYVHGHILAPHQPFVFDENGGAITPKHHYTCWHPIENGRDPKVYRKEYIAQLKFINSKLIATVEAILKNSKTPPIIIIQGDHGPCAELTNTKSFEGNNFRERMPILNAYYFPEGAYQQLYRDISPVNSLRTVFRQFFGMDYAPLPDSSYYSTWDYHYDLLNVTEQLR